MNAKMPGSLLQSNDVDSRRLAEVFFAPTSTKKLSSKKPVIIISFFGSIILLLTLFFVAKTYNFIVIPRTYIAESESDLLDSKQLASLTFINTAKTPAKISGSSISLVIPREEKIGVTFNLAKPHNLNTSTLVFAIQNAAAPLIMEVIIKDVHFHSIATNPVRLQVQTSKNYSLTTIPVSFTPEQTSRIDLSQIKQIKVFFHYGNILTKPTDIPLHAWEKQWVIIKDVLLMEKEA